MLVEAQRCDFGVIFGFRGIAKWTLGVTFSAKWGSEILTDSSGPSLKPTWTRLAPQSVQGLIFLQILDGFWTDLGWILDDF